MGFLVKKPSNSPIEEDMIENQDGFDNPMVRASLITRKTKHSKSPKFQNVGRIILYEAKLELEDFRSFDHESKPGLSGKPYDFFNWVNLTLKRDNTRMYFIIEDPRTRTKKELWIYLKQAS